MKVINRAEAAKLLGMTPNALGCHVYRKNWEGVPKPIKIGGKWKWVEEEVTNWLQQRVDEARGTSTPKPKSAKRGRPRKAGSQPCI